MTELDSQALAIFRTLSKKDKQTAVNLAMLVVRYPDFSEAIKAATPTGAIAPPWEVTECIVAEWMAKEGALCEQVN